MNKRVRNKEIHTCCICGKQFIGNGRSANPINPDGKCCRVCNTTVVLNARIHRYYDLGLPMRIKHSNQF